MVVGQKKDVTEAFLGCVVQFFSNPEKGLIHDAEGNEWEVKITQTKKAPNGIAEVLADARAIREERDEILAKEKLASKPAPISPGESHNSSDDICDNPGCGHDQAAHVSFDGLDILVNCHERGCKCEGFKRREGKTGKPGEGQAP
jgi:hypothetical protein